MAQKKIWQKNGHVSVGKSGQADTSVVVTPVVKSGEEASESLTATAQVNILVYLKIISSKTASGRVIIVARRLKRESPAVEAAIVGEEENAKVGGNWDLHRIMIVTMGVSIGQWIGLVTIAKMAKSYLLVKQGVENAIAGEVVSVSRLLGSAPSANLAILAGKKGVRDAWLGRERRRKLVNHLPLQLLQNQCHS